MKMTRIKSVFFVLCWMACVFSGFAQAKTDTIYIYDTVRVKIKRPVPQTFFAEQEVEQEKKSEEIEKNGDSTATFSEDSINRDVNIKQTSQTMTRIKERANRFIRSIAVGSLALIATVDSAFAQKDLTRQEMSKPSQNLEQSVVQPMPASVVDTVFQNVTTYETVEWPDTVNRTWTTPPMAEFPFYISFAHPVSVPINSEDKSFAVAMSFLTGSIGGLNGIQMAGLYNQLNGPGIGMQTAGLVNVSRRFKGLQYAGLCNFANEYQGVQAAGIMNVSNDIKGLQYAGIMNASDNLHGIQASGIYNVAGDVQGVQASAIYNKAENLRGLQIGLVNRAKSFNGVQIGLVNIVDSLFTGLPIGLVNFVKGERYNDVEVGYNIAFRSIYLGTRFGINKMYTIVDLAKSKRSDAISRFEFRYGLGNRLKLNQKFYLHTEFTWGVLYDIATDRNLDYVFNHTFVTRKRELSFGFAYFFSNNFNLKITPSIYHVSDLVNLDYYTGTTHNLYELGRRWGGIGANLRIGLSYKF